MAHYLLGSIASIPPGEGRNFAVGGQKLAVFHARNGCVYATQASCPHKSGPLADGLVGDSTLICPLHEWTFDLETGKAANGQASICTFPVEKSEDGSLVVEVPDA
jgi:nitrite reductase (NADH) small subunit